MKKYVFLCVLSAVLSGCTSQKVSVKENRFTKQFQQADSVFNIKYGLYDYSRFEIK